jgi:hypothetical protein
MLCNMPTWYHTVRREGKRAHARVIASHGLGDIFIQYLPSSRALHISLPRCVGPFQVVKQVSKQAHELELPAHWKSHDVFHVCTLQVYSRSGKCQPPPPADLLEGEPEDEVDHVVRQGETREHKNKPTVVEYLVAWRGPSPGEYTCEPAVHLKYAAGAVRTYWDNLAHGDKSVVPGSAPYSLVVRTSQACGSPIRLSHKHKRGTQWILCTHTRHQYQS